MLIWQILISLFEFLSKMQSVFGKMDKLRLKYVGKAVWMWYNHLGKAEKRGVSDDFS
jgi:iron uptake system EfeUOB component EfeO/EfeM